MHNSPESSIIYLDTLDLVIAAGFVIAAGVISLVLRLKLERRLAVASLRTVVQLLFLGYVLETVFKASKPSLIMAIAMLMLFFASHAGIRQSSRKFRGIWGMAFVSLVVSGFLVTYCVTTIIIGVEPWYRPQYLIPIFGMILGNSLIGISLCIDHLLEALEEQRATIEMELALGATRWEAARNIVSEAVRKGMIPIINSMIIVGIVSLPGTMTGQILAGASPLLAVKYQIVVMFMLAGATSGGCIMMALLVFKRMFNRNHQLVEDVILRR